MVGCLPVDRCGYHCTDEVVVFEHVAWKYAVEWGYLANFEAAIDATTLVRRLSIRLVMYLLKLLF